MIDTLHILLPYSTKISPNVEIDNLLTGIKHSVYAPEEEQPTLYKDTSGKEVKGLKATIYDKKYSLFITSRYKELQFSLPKVNQFDINLRYEDRKGAQNAIELIQDSLEEKGISVNLMDGIIKRADIYKNINLDHPFYEYENILKWIRCRRSTTSRHESSFYYKNGRRELIIYDKTKELIDKEKIKPETEMIIGSQMRVEYKCKNKEAVSSFLMFNTVQDLIDNWESLNDIYNNNLRNFIFCLDELDKLEDTSYESEAERLKVFYKDNRTSFWNNYRKYWASRTILSKWNSIEDLRMELKKYKIDAAVSRMLKDLQKEIPMDSDDLSISTSKLFYEFKEKLLS
jgi:hypothetical protein